MGIGTCHPSLCPMVIPIVASTHLLGIAGTMIFLAHQDNRNPRCPSCLSCKKTCCHIAQCPENGHTKAFQQSVAGVAS
jgi:hypothetical protein